MTNATGMLGQGSRLLVLCVCLTCGAACDVQRVGAVRVGPGPSFLCSGSGRLTSFTVFAPLAGRRVAAPLTDPLAAVWRITASKSQFDGLQVEHLQLTYGMLPDGYTQALPGEAQAAPPLAPDEVYSYIEETTDAPSISGFFYVGKTGPAQISVPDLCVGHANGRDVAVKCGTNEPYQEPADLERFARDHRVAK